MRNMGKARKLSISLPDELVAEIEEVDPDGGISGFLFRAALGYLAQERFLKPSRSVTGHGKRRSPLARSAPALPLLKGRGRPFTAPQGKGGIPSPFAKGEG